MKGFEKDEMDNVINVGVGNQMEYVGFYVGEDGNYLVDRTDGHSYTDDYPAENKIDAIKLLFEKVEEMIDESQTRLSAYYDEKQGDHPEVNFEEELKEKLDKIALTALYEIQRSDLKTVFNENELIFAESKHNSLVDRYNLKEVKDIDFNYYK